MSWSDESGFQLQHSEVVNSRDPPWPVSKVQVLVLVLV